MNTTTNYFDEHIVYMYTQIVNNYMPDFMKGYEYTPWIFSLLGSVVIGLSGILPLIIIPTEQTLKEEGYKDRKLIFVYLLFVSLYRQY